jgi:hypothetical protein
MPRPALRETERQIGLADEQKAPSRAHHGGRRSRTMVADDKECPVRPI